MTAVLCATLNVYLLIMLARAVLSWFPIRPDTAMASIMQVLLQLTEPVLVPVRRIIPPAGMFDLSFLVVIVLLTVLHSVIGCGGAFI